MAANKVEVNGETIIDLTSDTATESDVLTGKSFHLASGAVAFGTYSPLDEIEARLRATVGHSSKNLLSLAGVSTQSVGGITWTVDYRAGTITASGTSNADRSFYIYLTIPAGNYYYYGCPQTGSNNTYDVYLWDQTVRARPKQWDGTTNTESDYGMTPKQFQAVEGHQLRFTLRIRPGQAVSNLVFKPMVWNGSISDDTFEPYQMPTDDRIAEIDLATANASRFIPSTEDGIYWITIVDNFNSSTPFDIYISTPETNGGSLFGVSPRCPIPSHDVRLPAFRNYNDNAVSFGFIAGTNSIVMAISSNPGMLTDVHTSSTWDKQFSVSEFFRFRDLDSDNNPTNYITIHLCSDGVIRNKQEYENWQ